MARVYYEDPIEHLSGKISKNKQTVYNYRKSSKRKYTQVRSERSSEASENELAIRKRFRAVSAAVNARLTEPNHIRSDREEWKAALRNGDKHTTLRGWLFAKAWKLYDEERNQIVW